MSSLQNFQQNFKILFHSVFRMRKINFLILNFYSLKNHYFIISISKINENINFLFELLCSLNKLKFQYLNKNII